jgi:1,2-diacylglycerol 3-beta-galactosyltransferase
MLRIINNSLWTILSIFLIQQQKATSFSTIQQSIVRQQQGLKHAQQTSQLESSSYRHQSLSLRKKTSVLDREDDNDSGIVTIQILMSDTGGGHRASANALRDAFDLLYPGQIQCDIVDIYTEYGPFWPFNDYVNMYKLMAKYPWTWDIFYQFGATPFGMALNEFMLDTFCLEPFTKCISRPQKATGQRADMIISVHPLTQDIPLKIVGKLDGTGTSRTWQTRSKTPFVTVVTDLGSAHPTWFNPGVDKCFVPSDALRKAAQQRGLNSESQIVQYGLPIRKGFWNEFNNNGDNCGATLSPLQKKNLRIKLGINPDIPTVLVVGGGDGMGGLINISKELGQQLGSTTSKYQVVVVCGNNVDAQQELLRHTWPSNVIVHIQGFVNNMDEWMKASDTLVTKAGPGTIAEASICGLPCMMFSFLYVYTTK